MLVVVENAADWIIECQASENWLLMLMLMLMLLMMMLMLLSFAQCSLG